MDFELEMNEMKKLLCLFVVLILCAAMTLPVLAAETRFVPSAGAKDGPEIEDAIMDGEDVDQCLVVTTVQQAAEKLTDICQEERDLLQELYEKLLDGTMELPLDEAYVILDLVDVSFEHEDCRELEDHGNKPAKLAEEGVTLTATFDLGVGKYDDVIVMTYIDGQWTEVVSVVNNGDGTVTCVFEDICPVVFSVMSDNGVSPPTGDLEGNYLVFAVLLMVLSAAGIAILLTTRARKVN